jgi:hypothetical protein
MSAARGVWPAGSLTNRGVAAYGCRRGQTSDRRVEPGLPTYATRLRFLDFITEHA